MTHPSRFIVIEGIDGAGTTTQVEQLTANLRDRGIDVRATFEPSSGPVGRQIRKTLVRDPSAPSRAALPWLFAADRADHLDRVVEPALAAGTWVVSDRYYPSSLAYQSLSMPLDYVHALNARFRAPDLLVFVRVDLETALARIESRGGTREIFEERDRLIQINAQYDAVLERLAAAGEPLVEVDGGQPIDAVARAILAEVEGRWLAS